MHQWSFEILRQTTWDLWTLLCIAAVLILLSHAALRQRVALTRDIVGPILTIIATLGTILVLAVPVLRRPGVGLVWTFLLLSILSIVFYRALLDRLGQRRTGTLLAMRIAAIALLVPMLFEPVVRFVSTETPQRPVMLLVDDSGSMSVPDVQNGPTRLQSIWQALRPQLPRLSAHFIPRIFAFAADTKELDRADTLATLPADGKSTDLVSAVKTALTKTDRDDAILVLISDGIDNTSPDVVGSIAAMRRPVNTITVGSDQAESALLANVAVDDLSASDDFVVGHETTIKATIRSTALADRVVDVKLAEVNADGQPIDNITTQKLVLQPLPQGQIVSLKFKPAKVGVHRLAVWIDPIAGERTTADNRQELQGLALDPRIKVLYIEGRARPEYGSLSRSLNRDPNIELATLLRVQDQRFAAGGSVDGEAFKQMPTSLAEWKKFDVILLGDLDASFLTKAQQSQIEQTVKDGGALLMIGGQNTLGPGGYADTAIERALPVKVGPITSPQEKSEFVPRLTADGAAHPSMEGLSDWFGVENAPGTKPLPPLLGNVVVANAKPSAEVLAIHADRPGPDQKPQIVLAVEHYGKGRSAVFTVDTTYRWYLPLRGMGQDSPYNRLWGQLIRWLAGEDVRNRERGAGVEALLNKSTFQLGETVQVRAMVRDEKGDATRYAQVTVTLKSSKDDKPREQPMPPVESHTGMYSTEIGGQGNGLGNGDWTAEIVANKDGKLLGRQTVKFSILPPADEMLKIAANPKLMASIASATGGYSYPLSGLNDLVDALIRSDPTAGAQQERSVPLDNSVRVVMAAVGHPVNWPRRFDFPMQGAIIIGLLIAEWILRRRWQLT
ncbi:MAG: hypothetical protein JO353_00810 [Phycisphaerae bacterium]|nr:hypothetical protein [Phycisphaerae bacterium]